GGGEKWAEAVGIVPVASFTLTKLRWLARNEPDNAAKVAAVCLPHDWLTWKLSGSTDLSDIKTDRSDASGTLYWSARTNEYRHDLLELGFGRSLIVPEVLGPTGIAGHLRSGAPLGPG